MGWACERAIFANNSCLVIYVIIDKVKVIYIFCLCTDAVGKYHQIFRILSTPNIMIIR